ncbi:hypothetical protein DI392_03745 [Vibrio albus]|uniref:Uncharacterized protein n=1 Tax=Vibrio albus TaxID=2200953 RepID=A0A2U3BBS4_9VIBR|nr:hypothetical protein [Vibrio albus]PWI34240.1 hypothetical protein DI392_03745 [Vibrio albus]
MVLHITQFVMTTLLVVVCARAISMSEGDIPLLAIVVPALWILPKNGVAGILLLVAMGVYGLALPVQPIALSLSTWVLFPALVVAFSERSSSFVRVTLGLCVLSMEAGIMITQLNGRLEGSALATLSQLLCVSLAWFASIHWKSSSRHSWWMLIFIPILWLAGWKDAALVALSVTGILAASQTLQSIDSGQWKKLLIWTLPTVGFAALLMFPEVEIPNQVLVAWLFILGCSWAADYILNSQEDEMDD